MVVGGRREIDITPSAGCVPECLRGMSGEKRERREDDFSLRSVLISRTAYVFLSDVVETCQDRGVCVPNSSYEREEVEEEKGVREYARKGKEGKGNDFYFIFTFFTFSSWYILEWRVITYLWKREKEREREDLLTSLSDVI